MNWSNDGAKPIRIAADLRAVQLSKAAVLGSSVVDHVVCAVDRFAGAVSTASFGLFVAVELRANVTFAALMATLFLTGSFGMWWAQRLPRF